MAETVTVAHGDTLTGILKRKRGLNDGQIYTWLGKLRTITPHIGDLNNIFPGEKLLVPDSLMETISDDRVGFFRALGRHATWYVPAVILLFQRH